MPATSRPPSTAQQQQQPTSNTSRPPSSSVQGLRPRPPQQPSSSGGVRPATTQSARSSSGASVSGVGALAASRISDVIAASAPVRRAPPEPVAVDGRNQLPWWKRAVVDGEFRRALCAAISSAQRLLEEHATASEATEPWELPAPDRGAVATAAASAATAHGRNRQPNTDHTTGDAVGAVIDGNVRHITRTVSSAASGHRPSRGGGGNSAAATAVAATKSPTRRAATTGAFSRNTAGELALLRACKQRSDVALSRGDWLPFHASNRAPGDGATYRWIGDFPPTGFHIAYAPEMTQIGGLAPPTRPSFDTVGTAQVPASVAVFATRPEYPLLGGIVMPRDATCVYLVSNNALGKRRKHRHAQEQNADDSDNGDDRHPLLDDVYHTSEGGVRYLVCDRGDPRSVARTGRLPDIEIDIEGAAVDGDGHNSGMDDAAVEAKRRLKRKLAAAAAAAKRKKKQHQYCVPIVDGAEAEEEARRKLIEQKSRHLAASSSSTSSSSSASEDDDDEEAEEEEGRDDDDESSSDESCANGDGVKPGGGGDDAQRQRRRRRRRRRSHKEMLRARYGALLPKGAVGFAFGAPKFIAYMWPSHRLMRFRLLSVALHKLAQDERDPRIAAGFDVPSDPFASYLRRDLSLNRVEFLFSSDPCRESVQRIFDRLPKDAHNRLEQKSFVNFCLDLYNLYMPQYSDKTNFLLAESEWAARGVRDHSLDFLLFFWFFFDLPLFLIRGEFIREQDYAEFWDFTFEQLFVAQPPMRYQGVDFDDVMALRAIERQLQARVPAARLPNRARLELQLLKQRRRAHERRSQLLQADEMRQAELHSREAQRVREQQRAWMRQQEEAAAARAPVTDRPSASASPTAPAEARVDEEQAGAGAAVAAVEPKDNASAYRRRREAETQQLLSFREYLARFDPRTGAPRPKDSFLSSADDAHGGGGHDDDSAHAAPPPIAVNANAAPPVRKRKTQRERDIERIARGAQEQRRREESEAADQSAQPGDGNADDDDDDAADDNNNGFMTAEMLLAGDPDAPENNVEALLDFVDGMSDSDLEETDTRGRLVIFDRFRLAREIRRRRDDRVHSADDPPTRLMARNAQIDLARERAVMAADLKQSKALCGLGGEINDGDENASSSAAAAQHDDDEDPFPAGTLPGDGSGSEDEGRGRDPRSSKQSHPHPQQQQQEPTDAASLRVLLQHAAEVEEMAQDEDDDLATAARRRRRVARMLAVRRQERARLQELSQTATQLRKVNRYTMFGAPMLSVPKPSSAPAQASLFAASASPPSSSSARRPPSVSGRGQESSSGGNVARPSTAAVVMSPETSRNPRHVIRPPLQTGRYVRSTELIARRERAELESILASGSARQDAVGGTTAEAAGAYTSSLAVAVASASAASVPTTELALPLMGGAVVSKVACGDLQQQRRRSSAAAGGATAPHIRAALLQSGMTLAVGENIERWRLRESSGGGGGSGMRQQRLAIADHAQGDSDEARLARLFAAIDSELGTSGAASQRAEPDLPTQSHEDDEEIAMLLQKIREQNEQEAFLAVGRSAGSSAAASRNRAKLRVHASALADTLPDQRLPQPVVLPRSSTLNRDLLASREAARSQRPKPLFDFSDSASPARAAVARSGSPPRPTTAATATATGGTSLLGPALSHDERRSALFLAGHGRRDISIAHQPHPDMQLARWLTAVSRTQAAAKIPF